MTVLRSETALSLKDDSVQLEEERVVLFDSATWSFGPETQLGWWKSRLGFQISAETLSRPRDDLDFALRVRGGLNVTLLAGPDFADLLVVGVSFEGASWSAGNADVRLGAGMFMEACLALGDQRLRGSVRALPGWSFPGGFQWAVESSVGLALVLDRELGMVLQPSWTMRWDLPIPNAWEMTMGLSW